MKVGHRSRQEALLRPARGQTPEIWLLAQDERHGETGTALRLGAEAGHFRIFGRSYNGTRSLVGQEKRVRRAQQRSRKSLSGPAFEMGRLDLSAQRVHKYASQLMKVGRLQQPPPWYETVGSVPPSARLVRPVMQRPQKAGKKASRLFSPVKVSYEEDRLRWEYFNDHPWELARPRVILEDDGKDYQRWDWGHALCQAEEEDVGLRGVQEWQKKQKAQANRPINGEAVVQRQKWLMRNAGLTEAAAYDKARKELYRTRHAREIENRVAKEEAMAYGAFFGKGPLEIGMDLEDEQYANWLEWAKNQAMLLQAQANSAYTGNESDESQTGISDPQQEELQLVDDDVPASHAGQTALGGAAVHP